jgi:hypothetical protein
MITTYDYIDEAYIDPELICSICHSPFKDPCCAPCGETFCRECITQWIETRNTSCPICQKNLSLDALTQPTRMVRNMLDRILVMCIVCGETDLQRGNFNDHIEKVCPKIVVSCPSADIKCLWTGQRDQLNQHLLDCRFESVRPIIHEFIAEYQQLKDQVNQQIIQINGQQDEIGKLKLQLTLKGFEIDRMNQKLRE